MIDNPDAQVVAALQHAGSDLSQAHQVEFVFNVAEPYLDALVEALERLELDICIYAPEPDDAVSTDSMAIDKVVTNSANPDTSTNQLIEVVATKTMLLDVPTLNQWSARFEALAARYQASYDGWGAHVVD